MNTQTFALGKNERLKIDAARGNAVRVRSGDIWLTQHKDPNDYLLKTGQALPLNGEGTTLVTAFQPTLLELYREDPTGVRKNIERQSHMARNQSIRAFFAAVFCW